LLLVAVPEKEIPPPPSHLSLLWWWFITVEAFSEVEIPKKGGFTGAAEEKDGAEVIIGLFPVDFKKGFWEVPAEPKPVKSDDDDKLDENGG
jgi:hypothetical protein